ncbi:hypothetical protein CCB80_02200 [Armatimonadetes bacterium Uphvl-Ar1]|nr:hypothetical protein CCB80_02200 [Armatimonadetes bacterium Uphvl-Ar1]
MEDQGILSIADIPDSALKRADQRALKSTLCLSEPVIDRAVIRESLDSLIFPLFFIDYESVSLPVPPHNGTKPYQQVVFRYSLHILEDPFADVRHEEYLHTDSDLPTRSLVNSMREHVGNKGSVIVWNATFEKTRNKEMGEAIPDAKEFFDDMNSRLYDLMLFFKPDASFRDSRFKGSASIKKVLPVVVPDLKYTDLEVQEGQSASRIWRNIFLDGSNMGGRSGELVASLREYCKLDTLAMVEIYRSLYSL